MQQLPPLTDAQRLALQAADNRGPVTVVDPATSLEYVLLRADVYEQYRFFLDHSEFKVAEAYPQMDTVAGAEGWLDAEMDAYDRLDVRRPS